MKIAIAATLVFSSCTTTKIYLVRHAEKFDMSVDPPLSESGKKRALELRDKLNGKKIDVIYATSYQRTKLTAKPLAEAKGIPITEYESGPLFCKQLQGLNGKTVLVVGHSNRLPQIIECLTGDKLDIAEETYDNFFEITIRDGKATLDKSQYGN